LRGFTSMKDEDREKILGAFEEMASQIGVSSFDAAAKAVHQLLPLAKLFITALEKGGSRDQISAFLEQQPDLKPELVEVIVTVIKSSRRWLKRSSRNLKPQLTRYCQPHRREDLGLALRLNVKSAISYSIFSAKASH
jgi:hypothetical protein